MSSINFEFLTDECRWDNGQLRQALEDLCDLVVDPILINDPNSGVCGEYGPASTIDSVVVQPGGILEIAAQPAWGGINFNISNSRTFAPPLNMPTNALYVGVDLAVVVNNPSACRAMACFGFLVHSSVISYDNDDHLVVQVRDITGGAPGPVVGDLQRIAPNHLHFDERAHNIPITFNVAPGGSFSATYRTNVEKIADGGTSIWHQTILQFVGIGVLV